MGSAEPAAVPRRLLFISNGHGEDSIAAEIVRRLPPAVAAEAYPTLGDGRAYDGVCPIVGPRAALASEGWRNVKGSVLRDLANGGAATLLPGLRFGRRIRHAYDRVVVVGDLVGVAGCLVSGIRDIVYLDVYKTGYGRLYSPLERWLIRRTTRIAFCRSQHLADQLARAGVDARSAGNVMMDTISYGAYDAAARRRRPTAVTLLPGSRQFTAESFALQVAALRHLPAEMRPDVFLAAAGGVPLAVLAEATGLTLEPAATAEPGDGGTLAGDGITVHVGRGVAGNLLEAADVVLSQAGTATVQALGLGRPVLTFINPRDRRSRVRDENALFGEARQLLAPDPAAIATALERLLADPAERTRLGAIGRTRIGPPGALTAILAAVLG